MNAHHQPNRSAITRNRRRMPWLLAMSTAAAVMSLSACDKNDDGRTVGSKFDAAIANTEQKAAEMKADASKEMAEAKVAASNTAQETKAAVENASEKVGDKVNDAVITTSVNAELAKDASLSALKINVDTNGGRVALKGKAPDAAARERATSLALAVKGVLSVDNQLTLEKTGTM